MKNENDYNAYLSKQLRMYRECFHHKVSDKFAAGVSDFLIWYSGTNMALETKFINEFPSSKAYLLHHVFSGEQQTFLESIGLTGNRAYGAVVVKSTRRIHFIRYDQIPLEGNWKTHEFLAANFYHCSWDNVSAMLLYMLGDTNERKVVAG